MHGQRLEPRLVGARGLDASALRRVESRRQIGTELLDELRNAVGPPPSMADRVVDAYALAVRAVIEEHLDRVADRALIGIHVVATERGIFGNGDLRAQRID